MPLEDVLGIKKYTYFLHLCNELFVINKAIHFVMNYWVSTYMYSVCFLLTLSDLDPIELSAAFGKAVSECQDSLMEV